MAHLSQQLFCAKIKALFPDYFDSKKVLDIGGANINGSVKFLFKKCRYTVLDIWKGRDVTFVGRVTDLPKIQRYDVICCLEVAEHDNKYEETIAEAIARLKPGGLFLFTCATTGRAEHGTKRTSPDDSPCTTDYYKNVTEKDVRTVEGFDDVWCHSKFEVNGTDLYFYGIKKEGCGSFGKQLLLCKFKPSTKIFIKSYFHCWYLKAKRDIYEKTRKKQRSLR